MNEKTPDIKSSLPPKRNWIDHIIWFCLNNKLIVFFLIIFFVGWGIMVAPFDWNVGGLPRDPVAVDAILDIGENQPAKSSYYGCDAYLKHICCRTNLLMVGYAHLLLLLLKIE